MKKFLFTNLYRKAKVIGFDLDGTLYDEFDFIKPTYEEIVQKLVGPNPDILDFMLNRWLEKGSSYPKIFQETKHVFQLSCDFEARALEIFRDSTPRISLPVRMNYYLTKIKNDKKYLFLLTDGKEKLQSKKIDALKIRDCFDVILIAEDHQKPDPYYGNIVLEIFGCSQEDIVYVGDREVDKEFCKNCGFKFVKNTY